MDASDKEKADILLRIIGIGAELHTRDLEIKGLYDKRTFTGQLAAQKKHFAEEMISYPEAPDEPVSGTFWPGMARTSACGPSMQSLNSRCSSVWTS